MSLIARSRVATTILVQSTKRTRSTLGINPALYKEARTMTQTDISTYSIQIGCGFHSGLAEYKIATQEIEQMAAFFPCLSQTTPSAFCQPSPILMCAFQSSPWPIRPKEDSNHGTIKF
jgi:hypothetical protein